MNSNYRYVLTCSDCKHCKEVKAMQYGISLNRYKCIKHNLNFEEREEEYHISDDFEEDKS